ncbi:MAG: hypothetical protein DRJ10_06490 [Bacteroidetes bacterium]|nr:MAG: hypothetical protein DRJ10_06490 [Bacteroidota bacterium]
MNRLLVFIAIIIIPLSGFSQYFENKKEEKKPFKENIFYGGILGLQFGTYTLIDISPVIGYRVSPKFHPGLRMTYQYQSNQNYKTYRYGGSIFARLFLVEGLYAQAEAEALNIEWMNSNLEEYRLWIANYFVGGGYFQKIGKKGGMYMTVLWNLNETIYSPYSNPVIRMGFTF